MAKKKGRGKAPRPDVPASRWVRYRPTLERLVFGVALLGILVTAHMNIWWANYDAAAAGVAGSECGLPGVGGGTFDCAAAFTSGAGTLFGVSNAVWGLLFYLVVAALSLVVVYGGIERRVVLNKLRAGLVGFGALYTVYLTGYQLIVLPNACLLCLISAFFVLVLLVLIGVYFFGAAPSARRPIEASPNTKLYAGLSVLLLLLLAGDYAYIASQEPATTVAEASAIPARDIDVETQCHYDTSKPYYENIDMLVDASDPVRGDPEAPVTVIEFLDPNCPHCKTLHPVMKAVADRMGDQARFVYKPVALMGQQSVAQVAVLNAAAEDDAFFEMLEYQFANQDPRQGLSFSVLSDVAEDIGMNMDGFRARIQSGASIDKVRRQARLFRDLGLSGVPTVIVDGRVVASRSRNVECLSYFIEQAAASDASSPSDTSAAVSEAVDS